VVRPRTLPLHRLIPVKEKTDKIGQIQHRRHVNAPGGVQGGKVFGQKDKKGRSFGREPGGDRFPGPGAFTGRLGGAVPAVFLEDHIDGDKRPGHFPDIFGGGFGGLFSGQFVEQFRVPAHQGGEGLAFPVAGPDEGKEAPPFQGLGGFQKGFPVVRGGPVYTGKDPVRLEP
jgi:hypothetical protein